MRYAIISDIHANCAAMEVALKKIEEYAVDLIVNLGDVVGYNSEPNECCDRMRVLKVPTIS